MFEANRRRLVPLLRLLLPAKGCHRLAGSGEAGRPAADGGEATVRLPRVPGGLVLGEDVRLVRPYLEEHERRYARGEARQHKERRRDPLPVLDGVESGPRRIHGVEVAA